VQTEVRVARWLADARFPAIRLADIGPIPQPFEAGGRPVTVWDLVETSPERPTMTDLAPVLRGLRGLHDLAPPPGLGLGPFKPFRDLPDRLALARSSVPRDDVDFLRQRAQELGEAYAALSFERPRLWLRRAGNYGRKSGDARSVEAQIQAAADRYESEIRAAGERYERGAARPVAGQRR
jgi:hypothetical protein